MSEIQIQAAIAALGAIVSLWLCLNRFSRIRAISNTPTSRIRSAAQGYCELIGVAKRDQPLLRAPLSGAPCLWFSYRVEQRVRSGKSYHWRTVRHETSNFSFYLDDSTGLCHLHPEGASVDPMHRDNWNRSPLNAHELDFNLGMGRYRYSESRIVEGDLIYALGNFQTVYPLSIDQQSEQHQIELLREWKKDHEQLLQRFDSNQDGQIDATEWEAARAEAARTARLYTLESPDREPAHMLVRPPSRRQHFILSSRDPKRLVSRYRWQAVLAAILFLGLVGATGYLLAQA